MTGDEIYKVVTPQVKKFYREFRWLIPDFVDVEDFVQEAAIVYLNNPNRPIRFVCLDYLISLLPSDGGTKQIYSYLSLDDPEISEDLMVMPNVCNKLEAGYQLDKDFLQQNHENYRYILYKKFFEDKSLSEIGEELNLSKSTVSRKFNSCLEKLKKLNEKMP